MNVSRDFIKVWLGTFLSFLETCIENLYSPDKVHPIANNENKNNIKLTKLPSISAIVFPALMGRKELEPYPISVGDENAGPENDGPNSRDGKWRIGKMTNQL